uniref:Putative terminase n=1 Tax=viral metagenome TaxID=1070528 RepID=A0A6M3MCX7_9ZZZZ
MTDAVPIDRAVDIAQKVSKEMGFDTSQEKLVTLISTSCQPIEIDGTIYFSWAQLNGFISNLQKAFRSGDSSFLLQKRGLRVDRVVDIEEFIESAEYLDLKYVPAVAGSLSTGVWPSVKKKLVEFFADDGYVEAVCTGGIGVGKTFFAYTSMAYMIYKLSCYHNPQLEYGLAPGSSIIFIQQSKTATLAKKVVFEQFVETTIRRSPYFRNKFPWDNNIKSELRFPNHITVLPIGGSDTGALGMNVFGGIIDELNFMDRIQDSVETRFTGEDEYDQAKKIYSSIIRRMNSRFEQQGSIPGKLILVSSRNYPGDFTDLKMKEAKEELAVKGKTSVFVMNYALWEAVPPERLLPGRFYVEVGNETKSSRILQTREQAEDPEDVIEVPENYRRVFEVDIDDALRELAGRVSGTRKPFIPYREKIEKAQAEFEALTGGRQLFAQPQVIITDFADDWEKLVSEEYIEEVIVNPEQVFAAHLDVGLGKSDAAGLALGRIIGYKMLPAARVYSKDQGSMVEVRDITMPIYILDGVLRIVAPASGEIDLDEVRNLILYIRGLLNLKWCTMDSYQAPMFYTAFRKVNIRSGVMSVDTDIAPYAELKMSIKEERILFPRHETLAKEMREVEKDQEKDIVDHPPGGSKDVSDGAAGTVYTLQRKEMRFGRSTTQRGGGSSMRKIRIGARGSSSERTPVTRRSTPMYRRVG